MTIARHLLVKDHIESTYHCISRCVRRAYLCGIDPYSGKNFEHRKKWVEKRLKLLSEIFAIDICGFAVMSNHLHVILRNRPDLSTQWSEQELCTRWWNLFPKRRKSNYRPADPTDLELKAILAGRPADLTKQQWKKELRRRLTNISWFMRCLNENIARRSNREDECTGRFWEGRFKCQLLASDAAILACSAYVDLNPIRAKLAKTPEKSDHTSIQLRIKALVSKQQIGRYANKQLSVKQAHELKALREHSERAKWLCPIGKEPKNASYCGKRGKPVLESITLEKYIQLVDSTGRQLKKGKKGSIPKGLESIIKRLGMDVGVWHETVTGFGRMFYRVVGTFEALKKGAEETSQRWLKGTNACKAAFG